MAARHSRVAFTIFIAIALAYHFLPTFVEADTSNNSAVESTVKNLTRLTMDQIMRVAPDFSSNGEIGRLINQSNPLCLSALRSCGELLHLAVDNLNKSLSTAAQTVEGRGSMKSMLCAAGTTLHTCHDGFGDQAPELRKLVFEKLKTPISLNSESTKFMSLIDDFISPTDQSDASGQDDAYPQWMSDSDRKLLEDSKISANVVVARDGSGKYKRIADAINAAPKFSKHRFVIYVKSGRYRENVRVWNDRTNLMMIGDGMDKTIIYGNLSYGGGYQTWDSATFAVQGEGFIARDIGFTNTAGAANKQAVALASAADRSVFYKCKFEGYQDTLFAQSNRQLYRECQIYGTIDFIFGGASVVVQKCGIHLRRPLWGQQNTIAAHYRMDRSCPTAISLQRCAVVASGDLRGVASYLGRPWTPYGTVAFLQNELGDLIHPKGWLPWDPVKRPVPPDTVFLAEYANKGASARTKDRVKWKGVRVSLSDSEAWKFTVGSLIHGDKWLPATQVYYDPGL